MPKPPKRNTKRDALRKKVRDTYASEIRENAEAKTHKESLEPHSDESAEGFLARLEQINFDDPIKQKAKYAAEILGELWKNGLADRAFMHSVSIKGSNNIGIAKKKLADIVHHFTASESGTETETDVMLKKHNVSKKIANLAKKLQTKSGGLTDIAQMHNSDFNKLCDQAEESLANALLNAEIELTDSQTDALNDRLTTFKESGTKRGSTR